MGHVKLLGQLFDRCQLVLVQLVEFLSRSNEQASSAGAREKHSYLELLPDLQTLCLAILSVFTISGLYLLPRTLRLDLKFS